MKNLLIGLLVIGAAVAGFFFALSKKGQELGAKVTTLQKKETNVSTSTIDKK